MEWQLSGPDADGFERVSVMGECDLYNAPRFTTVMLDKIMKGWQKIRIDMSGVSYLDSTGVGSLIKILQRAKALKGEVRFIGIRGSPRRVLVMSNIISLIREDDKPGVAPA